MKSVNFRNEISGEINVSIILFALNLLICNMTITNLVILVIIKLKNDVKFGKISLKMLNLTKPAHNSIIVRGSTIHYLIVLKIKTYIQLNDDIYQQKFGIAMGSYLSPIGKF